MTHIHVVGTADTKGEELAFLCAEIARKGGRPLLVDVGIRAPAVPVDISSAEVARFGAEGLLQLTDRGTAVRAMMEAFAAFAASRTDISGIIGIGGGGGTSIVTAGMRRLPIGLPKLMVSTLASGDVAPYVGVSDIMMMPSITDMAGLNRISRLVLSNAASAITAMSAARAEIGGGKPPVGLTMFGVTTPAVTAVAEALKADWEPLVFHATGTGGRSLEGLVDSGLVTAMIDLTTTEICDEIVGGVLSAGPDRLGAVQRRALPYVGSVGACDMVNFWARDTVPARFAGRLLYQHNANITLMRTTAAECEAIGAWIGTRLDASGGPIRFLIPEKGVSALDIAGGPFWDPVADEALFSSIERTLRPRSNRRIERLPFHINDPDFARAVVAAFHDIAP